MAHIPDGVLSAPVLVTGAAVTVALTAIALRRLDDERLPVAAVLAAAFFVSSLISVPVGPSAVHLLLNGLMGLVLGLAAVPALLVALLLQAVFFGFGGLVVLGVNTMNMAVPAVACALLLRPLLMGLPPGAGRRAVAIGAAAGALGVLLTAALLAASLAASGAAFVPAAWVIAVTYAPLALVEALVTGIVVGFLYQVEPVLLGVAGAEVADDPLVRRS